MSFLETTLFYLAIGVAVAVAAYLRVEAASPLAGAASAVGAVLFWPLYVPILLAPRGREASNEPDVSQPRRDDAPNDDLAAAIAQVEAELDTALAGLGGWAEDALAKEYGRIKELRLAWRAQAQRIRDIDALLTTIAASEQCAETDASAAPLGERLERSRSTRQRNFERLVRVRSQAYDDLLGTLAWVRELVSMIHLARFTGAPASRAEELVAQIAAAVAGVSAVSWSEVEEIPVIAEGSAV